MTKIQCPLCQGDTTPCYVIAGKTPYWHCHGMEKNWLRESIRQCSSKMRVCVQCGYIMLFADNPAIFQVEVDKNEIGDTPIPAMPPSPETDALPIPADKPSESANRTG